MRMWPLLMGGLLCLLPLGVATASGAEANPAAEAAPAEPTPEEKADAELGESAARELEKTFKVEEDPAELPRLTSIVNHIRAFTEKPGQNYIIKVLDTKSINALALPGGHLYFTRGLLEAVESEDELAAVSGHEMAHICLNHSRRLMSQDERYAKVLGPIIIAAILSNSKVLDPGAVATVGSLIAQDALNHYGREAELEADRRAVFYLRASPTYNPVAMLTVAEGLARIEAGRPQVEMGVFQTHPLARERAEALNKQLTDLGIPINRRAVTKSLEASAATVEREGREIGEVRLNDRVVYEPATEVAGASPVARAHATAEILNSLLAADLQLLELEEIQQPEQAVIRARGEAILTITAADAAFHQTSVPELARKAMNAIRLGFQEERIRRAY